MCEAHAFGRAAGALEVEQRNVHPVRHAIEQADLQSAAVTRGSPLDQRFQHAGMRRHAARDVAGGHADAARAGRVPGNAGQAAFRLHEQVVGLHAGIGVAVAVAADVDRD